MQARGRTARTHVHANNRALLCRAVRRARPRTKALCRWPLARSLCADHARHLHPPGPPFTAHDTVHLPGLRKMDTTTPVTSMTLEDAFSEAKRFRCQGNRFGENVGGECGRAARSALGADGRHVQAQTRRGRVVQVHAVPAPAGPAVAAAATEAPTLPREQALLPRSRNHCIVSRTAPRCTPPTPSPPRRLLCTTSQSRRSESVAGAGYATSLGKGKPAKRWRL